MTRSTRRVDVAAAIAGIVLGGFAGAGVVSASGGGEVVTCVQDATGAVSAGGDCGPVDGTQGDRESAAR
jgi:hypothetical protein